MCETYSYTINPEVAKTQSLDHQVSSTVPGSQRLILLVRREGFEFLDGVHGQAAALHHAIGRRGRTVEWNVLRINQQSQRFQQLA